MKFLKNHVMPFKKNGQTFVALGRNWTLASVWNSSDQQGIEGYIKETNTGVSLKTIELSLQWETVLNNIRRGVEQIHNAVNSGTIQIEMLPCEIFVEARQFGDPQDRVRSLYQHIGPYIGGIYIRWNNGWTDINSRSPKR